MRTKLLKIVKFAKGQRFYLAFFLVVILISLILVSNKSLIKQASISPSDASITTSKATDSSEVKVNQETSATITLRGQGNPINVPLDIILVMDRTGSMRDIYAGSGRTKFDVAKDALNNFVNVIQSNSNNITNDLNQRKDQLSFVYFSAAGSAVSQSLTKDYDAVRNSINSMPGPNGGTNVGKGLDLANNELNNHSRQTSKKIIIFAGDGGQNAIPAVDNLGSNGGVILKYSMNHNYFVYTIGIGDTGFLEPSGQPRVTPNIDWTIAANPFCPGNRCPGTADNHCSDPNYSPFEVIHETGSCLFQRIATYTKSALPDNNATGGYFNAPTPGELTDLYERLASIIQEAISEPGLIIEERLPDNMQYIGIGGATYYSTLTGQTVTFDNIKNLGEYTVTDRNGNPVNGFNLTLGPSIFIGDIITITFRFKPTVIGNHPVDLIPGAKLEYRKLGQTDPIIQDIAQAFIDVTKGMDVIGDVHAGKGLTINGNTTGVITSGGQFLEFFSAINREISNYTLRPGSSTSWQTSLADANKRITSIKNIAKNGIPADRNLNPNNLPEGGVYKITGQVLENYSFTGKGTIIVEGDLTIRGGINTTAPVGFIVNNGSVRLIASGNFGDTSTFNASFFVPYGSISVLSDAANIVVNGFLVGQSINFTAPARTQIAVYYDSRFAVNPPAGFDYIRWPKIDEKAP